MIHSFLNYSYLINLFYFLFVVLFAFYIPGNVLIRRFNFSLLVSFTYSIILGIVLWAIQGYLLGFLQLRQFSFLYLIIFFLIWIKFLFKNPVNLKLKFSLSKNDIPVIIILILGIAVQLFFNIFNGAYSNQGLYFCCGIPDSLYHIALVNSLIKSFPPFEPAMYDMAVKNYHYLANLVTADLIRVFNLPFLTTQTNYIVFLISSLIGLSVISLGKILKLGNIFISFLLLFIYFFGDITYLLTFILGKGFNFSVPFLYNATDIWSSPPRAFAMAISFMAIGLLYLWIKKEDKYLTVILAVVIASLIGFKVYNGISIFFGLLFLSSYYFLKKEFSRLQLIIISLVIGLLIYIPVNSGASGLGFIGFWRFENFISQPGFNLGSWELARYIYLENNNYLRIVQYELTYILLYFVFVFGILNISIFQSKKYLLKLPTELHVFLIGAILSSLVLGLFFFQKISGANSSQFLISAEVLISIYAALACTFLYKKFGQFKYLFLGIVILLTVPRVIDVSYSNYKRISNFKGLIITKDELSALNYLQRETSRDSIIFSDNQNLKVENQCYYIFFIAKRNMYLCDGKGILLDHGVDTEKRYNDYRNIINSPTKSNSIKLLENAGINYLYLGVNATSSAITKNKRFKQVFENEKIRIIKFN